MAFAVVAVEVKEALGRAVTEACTLPFGIRSRVVAGVLVAVAVAIPGSIAPTPSCGAARRKSTRVGRLNLVCVVPVVTRVLLRFVVFLLRVATLLSSRQNFSI